MAKMNYQKLSDYQYTHKPVITYSNSFSGSVIDRINKLLDVKKKPKKKAKPKAKAKRKPKQRTNLRVPYSEKDKAKALGAKWDAKKKVWYCVGSTNRLQKWL